MWTWSMFGLVNVRPGVIFWLFVWSLISIPIPATYGDWLGAWVNEGEEDGHGVRDHGDGDVGGGGCGHGGPVLAEGQEDQGGLNASGPGA